MQRKKQASFVFQSLLNCEEVMKKMFLRFRQMDLNSFI